MVCIWLSKKRQLNGKLSHIHKPCNQGNAFQKPDSLEVTKLTNRNFVCWKTSCHIANYAILLWFICISSLVHALKDVSNLSGPHQHAPGRVLTCWVISGKTDLLRLMKSRFLHWRFVYTESMPTAFPVASIRAETRFSQEGLILLTKTVFITTASTKTWALPLHCPRVRQMSKLSE